MLNWAKTIPTLSLVLAVLMALPTSIPLSAPEQAAPASVARHVGKVKSGGPSLGRHDRKALVDWSDQQVAPDGVEESDGQDDTRIFSTDLFFAAWGLHGLIPSRLEASTSRRQIKNIPSTRLPHLRC